MTWHDAQLAIHHLTEERLGKAVREEAALEDAQFEQAKQALR
jgi:hypothetical protein